MANNSIEMIALDLDGTTLDSKGHLRTETKDALQKAVERGIHVVVATGRVYSALPKDIFGIEGIQYIITSNGARITRLADMKILFKSNLDSAAVETIARILSKEDYMVEVFTDGSAFVEKDIFDNIEKYGLSEKHTNYIKNTRNPRENIFQFLLDNKEEIENININFWSQDDRMAMRKRMEELGIVTVTTSFDHNIELGGLSTSKAAALKALCEILNVNTEKMMACGDSPNDIEMLKLAGLPIAVGNAKDEVKACAKAIVGTNDENGVAEAVYRFALNL